MNKDIERLFKIQKRLDKKKFHLCVQTNLDDEYRWILFLYNPNIEDYLSHYNRPILDSSRTTLDELEDYLKKYEGFEWR